MRGGTETRILLFKSLPSVLLLTDSAREDTDGDEITRTGGGDVGDIAKCENERLSLLWCAWHI